MRKRVIRFLVSDKSREGSSPYGRGLSILANDCMASGHNSAAQVVLAWGMQRGTIVIPKGQSDCRPHC